MTSNLDLCFGKWNRGKYTKAYCKAFCLFRVVSWRNVAFLSTRSMDIWVKIGPQYPVSISLYGIGIVRFFGWDLKNGVSVTKWVKLPYLIWTYFIVYIHIQKVWTQLLTTYEVLTFPIWRPLTQRPVFWRSSKAMWRLYVNEMLLSGRLTHYIP